MNAPAKLGLYAVLLGSVLAGSVVVGSAAEPVGLSNAVAVAEHQGMSAGGETVPGLASAAEGYQLHAAIDTLPAGQATTFEFTVSGEDGIVTDFDLQHTKRMHFIVVRRDLTGFLHQHPTMAADGTWSTTLTLDAPGVYRAYADFVVDGQKHTLGTDIFVAGTFQPIALPAPSMIADAGDGYTVELEGDVVAGEESTLGFTIRRNGKAITDIPDYLGARGHLVALRDGDLAYLHVHADEDRLEFETDFPTPGAYRLFLQFRHGDQVRTAAFTVDAREASR